MTYIVKANSTATMPKRKESINVKENWSANMIDEVDDELIEYYQEHPDVFTVLGKIGALISQFSSINDLPNPNMTNILAMIGGETWESKNGWYERQGDKKPFIPGATLKDTPAQYDIDLTSLAATVARSGVPMTTGGSRATNTSYGTILEWDANLNLADGNYVAVAYEPATPLNLSDTDRLMFEFLHDNNWMDTRMQIILSSQTGTIVGGTHFSSRFLYQSNKKLAAEALMLRKSDFAIYTQTGVDFSSIRRVEFRLTKHSTGNPNQRARVELRRMVIGHKTRPMILLTMDDNATQLYDAHVRNAALGLRADIFCTDYELPTEDNHSAAKCTLAQDKVLAAAGYRFFPHNIDHKAYSIPVKSYSRVGDTVTLVITGYGGVTTPASEILPAVGEYIIIEDARAEQLNGRWAVASITPGTASTDTTLTITVTGASFDDSATGDGANITVEKYLLLDDIQMLQSKISRTGLPTNNRYLAYTYGYNSRTNRKNLSKIGITLARSTAGTNTQPEFDTTNPVFQISRRWGMGGQSDRLLSIPTLTLTTAAALQTAIDKLLATGGVLSVYTHGDDISNANIDACYTLMATQRNAGNLDIVNMSELEAHILARVN